MLSLEQRSCSVERDVTLPSSQTRARAIAPTASKKVAVLVTHGMGQQIQFETMDSVAEGLARYSALEGRPLPGKIRAATVRLGEQKLQRIEMALPKPDGNGTLEVHIYEAYWAPITEGQVTIRDVLSFLLRGGINGLRNAFTPFYRWIFGGAVSFGWKPGTAISLCLALLVVLSLVVVNFIVTALFADRLVGVMSGAEEGSTFTDEEFAGFTTLVGRWVGFTALLGTLLYAVHLAKPRLAPNPTAKARNRIRAFWDFFLSMFGWLLWIPLIAWVAATIGLGVVLAGGLFRAVDVSVYGSEFFMEHSLLVWGALIVVSWIVRHILVQFPGDVAAYIATHTLDRFREIRSDIKAKIADTAKAIYGGTEYHGVVWVGHSLGSVIAYDALNALIMDDELGGPPNNVVDRTNLLLTFGSPLDKTAFIFASQWANTTKTREALAASFQPLVLDYARFRKIPWVNVYSRSDIISGQLDFYDDKEGGISDRWVQNRIDLAASTPLLAHVEYWNNKLIAEQIYQGLMRGEPGAAQVGTRQFSWAEAVLGKRLAKKAA